MSNVHPIRPTLESQLRASCDLGPERLRSLYAAREERRRVEHAASHCAVCGELVAARSTVVASWDSWRVVHERCARGKR